MHPTRRGLLGLLVAAPALAVAACSPSPVVTGDPAEPWSPPPPEQPPALVEASRWVAGLRSLAAFLGANADAWELSGGAAAWAPATVAQSDAQLDRLLAPDPFAAEPERLFDAPEGLAVPDATDVAAFDELRLQHATDGVDLFGSLVREAPSQPERLLHACLGAVAAGLRSRSVAPVGTAAVPVRFPATTVETSLDVALSHVWALLHALEVGMGRVGAGDLRDLAATRLNSARALRNDLRAASSDDDLDQAVAYALPNDMATPQEIREALALQELRVCDALARLVAAGEVEWFDALVIQVRHAQAWGAALPVWPGWAEV